MHGGQNGSLAPGCGFSFKLYRDGSLFAVADRHEQQRLHPGGSEDSDAARAKQQAALDSMPRRALQTYGAEGHAGWVHFRNIGIIELKPAK